MTRAEIQRALDEIRSDLRTSGTPNFPYQSAASTRSFKPVVEDSVMGCIYCGGPLVTPGDTFCDICRDLPPDVKADLLNGVTREELLW